MKNGRINERNVGKYRLDGGIKGVKPVESNLTDKETKIKEAIHFCKMILRDGIKLYDSIPNLVKYWIDNGIAEIKEFENSCEMARKYKPFEKRAILIENKRKDVVLVKDLMVSLFEK